MTKQIEIRKLIIKIFSVFFVVIQFIFIFNFVYINPVNAQGKCGGVGAFVNWRDCLGFNLSTNNSLLPTDFYFINSGYTDFYHIKVIAIGEQLVCTTYNVNVPPVCQNSWVPAKEGALNATIAKLISDIISLILFAMLGIFLFLIFKAAYIYVTAGDNDDSIQKSKKTFSTGGWGLLIVIVGFIVVGIVGSLLGLGNFWEIKFFI